jgi:hypothetical protein
MNCRLAARASDPLPVISNDSSIGYPSGWLTSHGFSGPAVLARRRASVT